jgi:hypothetical protein
MHRPLSHVAPLTLRGVFSLCIFRIGSSQAHNCIPLKPSPYSRLVRELLCELETTYIVRNVGKTSGSIAESFPPIIRHNKMKNYMPGTENRRKFLERAGKIMVPYIVDPNTSTAMWETADIRQYLKATYEASHAS